MWDTKENLADKAPLVRMESQGVAAPKENVEIRDLLASWVSLDDQDPKDPLDP